MIYFSETQKIRHKVLPYLSVPCVDYGCGNDKVIADAIGVDCRKLPGVDIICDLESKESRSQLNQYKGRLKSIYSSHFLEHVKDDIAMVRWWISLLEQDGYLILYLPDDHHYDNDSNPEHFQRYTYSEFCKKIKDHFSDSLDQVNGGLDIGHDKYSFFYVGRKMV